jgi:hypothetical protein
MSQPGPRGRRAERSTDQRLDDLETRARAIEDAAGAASWAGQSVALAVGLGVIALGLLLPWLRGSEHTQLDVDEFVRGFELTPYSSNVLPQGVGLFGAFVFWFLVLAALPTLAVGVRGRASYGAVAATAQFVLLCVFLWVGAVARDEAGARVANPSIGLVLELVTMAVLAVVAFSKWREDRLR